MQYLCSLQPSDKYITIHINVSSKTKALTINLYHDSTRTHDITVKEYPRICLYATQKKVQMDKAHKYSCA